MFSKTLAVGVLAAGCVAAAAGGAYVAVRHNATSEAPPVANAPASPLAEAPEAPRPVAETEAVVTPSPAREAPKPGADLEATPPKPRRSIPPVQASQNQAPNTRRAANAAASRPATSASSERPAYEPPRAEATAPVPSRDAREPSPEPPVTVPASVPGRADAEAGVRPENTAPRTPQFEQLIVPASSVVGLQVETPLTTERARVEDRIDARVTRDVMAEGRVAIPAGARAIGTVTLVERGGKLKERARLGVRFHTLVLADGTEVPISTEAIYREGESPAGESTRKIGGATIGGAILGAIMGGKKGAVVGGATGAAGGTAVVMAGDRNAATLPSGTIVTIRLAAPVAVEVEKR